MKFLARIDIMPHTELLDPQGKTVNKNIHNIGVHDVDDIRIGKHIEITLNAESEQEARDKVETSCRKLLANIIMENYTFSLEKL
ncbi:MAG TPA: phosphoribosylformylglycinamidine synthase subunit PurS [Saprospiraceae bacterium]|nr:phosphoribosylformylglycinamidine synthase subunit PurS [Saprospiraceae bacterium]HPK09426.1 phosphoribosylformylglycinamidine synthase subunit PurS [Saprospiraceae bacterium]HPQ22659.1 phosphoribosylformylglycinamidine synthase subunit PurS [Saprospiraceae bacterium]HRX29155.1 phosphoribosylformylglycinamidine synthase subunit PurS [Saprospiraceae bacterium]